MTLAELQTIVADIQTKSADLTTKVADLSRFVTRVSSIINDTQFNTTLNIDQFVAIQTPLYLALLHNIEVAADALGTDLA